MIVIAALLLVLASLPLAGGSFSRLATVEIRGTWLIVVGFTIQTMVISVAPGRLEPIADTVHILSYLMAGAFVVINMRIRGLWILGLGGAMNFAAIAVNGGTMPAGEWATQVSGLAAPSGEFANSAVISDAELWFLGDIFPIPAEWPLSNVFSLGDVVLVVGAAVLLHGLSGSRLALDRGGALSVPSV